ncbi:IclR family transcriptional regulator C-terminal domain-containing protein [Paenarthrobacter sp. NPDC091669]|uniref:IclR family transcriptional regulator domain-containing protein n=1 Tax=Paenarthrobacter sp. NPDC091669 TaxID=3364384 RepID=UPI0037F628D9
MLSTCRAGCRPDAGLSENVHARASGKLLLAFASRELRESVLRRTDLTAITPHSTVSRAELDREFELMREQDSAWDRQEFREGVECVSASIRENGVVVACLTLSCPAQRFALRRIDSCGLRGGIPAWHRHFPQPRLSALLKGLGAAHSGSLLGRVVSPTESSQAPNR